MIRVDEKLILRGGHMLFCTYIYEGQECVGIIDDNKQKVFDMKELFVKLGIAPPKDMIELIAMKSDDLIEDMEQLCDIASGIPMEEVRLTSPIPHPIRNVFCLGKNYHDHIKELAGKRIDSTGDIPEYPIYFTKAVSTITGPMDDVVMDRSVTTKVDYEVELVIIIGKDGKDIEVEDVYDHIFGYSIGNDFSARDLQANHRQWLKGKSLDTFCAMGPWIVHKCAIKDPHTLDIRCKVNGEVRQSSNTQYMIFDIPYIVSDLSKGLELRAGDIIFTGTPSGVGLGFDPPRFLKDGDVVECEIEGIGSFINTIKEV